MVHKVNPQHKYRKHQILHGTNFRSSLIFNVRKTVAVLQYIFERAIEIKFYRENFHVLSKIRENCENFVPRRICCLRYEWGTYIIDFP